MEERGEPHHDDAMVHQVVAGVVRFHEIHPKQFRDLFHFVERPPEANHARMELLDIRLDELSRVPFRVDGDKDWLHLHLAARLCTQPSTANVWQTTPTQRRYVATTQHATGGEGSAAAPALLCCGEIFLQRKDMVTKHQFALHLITD